MGIYDYPSLNYKLKRHSSCIVTFGNIWFKENRVCLRYPRVFFLLLFQDFNYFDLDEKPFLIDFS